MKNGEDIFKDFQESLEPLKGRFHVLENKVPIEKQMEYFHFSEKVKKKSGDLSIESQIDVLNRLDTSEKEKRFAMTFLAISGDVKAYRALESYSKKEYTKFDYWLKMSLIQATIILESELSDEKQVFISTGLGGHGSQLRFFSLFKSHRLIPFSTYQIQLIEKEFPFIVDQYGGTVENIHVASNYFTLVFISDLKVNVKNMLEEAMNECNQFGNFISGNFIITNVKILSDVEIQRELKKG